MSASTTPTFCPEAASAAAMFTVTEDLPTPPFPLATAYTRVSEPGLANGISGSGLPPLSLPCRSLRCSSLITSSSTCTRVTPSSLPTAAVTSLVMVSRSGQPATVSQTSSRTVPAGRISVFLTMPRSVIGRWISGSLTPSSARMTCSALGGDECPTGAVLMSPSYGCAGCPVEPRPARPAPGRLVACPFMTRTYRLRRSCLAVPGSSRRFIDKARGLPCDEVFLDLEDAVAPAVKAAARRIVIEALTSGDWGGKLRAVRVNDVRTPWAYRDVIDVVEGAAANMDAIVLPKVTGPADVSWLDLLLTQLEGALGQPAGRIGIEAQIEDASGLAAVDAIAAASPRLEALVFGPADFMASLGMRSLTVGAQPAGYPAGDAFHYAHLRILVAARAHGLQAIDGPFAVIRDIDGLTASAANAAAIGFDGKWVLHPSQVDVVNAEFSPTQAEYDRAELIIEAYEYYTNVQRRGAAMLDGEMIDEASRKLAMVAAARGRAAGLQRIRRFEPPGQATQD